MINSLQRPFHRWCELTDYAPRWCELTDYAPRWCELAVRTQFKIHNSPPVLHSMLISKF